MSFDYQNYKPSPFSSLQSGVFPSGLEGGEAFSMPTYIPEINLAWAKVWFYGCMAAMCGGLATLTWAAAQPCGTQSAPPPAIVQLLPAADPPRAIDELGARMRLLSAAMPKTTGGASAPKSGVSEGGESKETVRAYRFFDESQRGSVQ